MRGLRRLAAIGLCAWLAACSADARAPMDDPGAEPETAPTIADDTATTEPETPLALSPASLPAAPLSAADAAYQDFAAQFAAHQALSDRAERIAYRLRLANAPLCERRVMEAGLSVHRLSDYPPRVRPLAAHFLGLDENDTLAIRSVVPGSAADRARLRAGDEIEAGWPLSVGRGLRLAGSAADIELTLNPACDIPLFIEASEIANASTDGRVITLSTALIETTGADHGLAFVIAHEMSHVLRAHGEPSWTAELEADRDALTLMHNARFDTSALVEGWEAGIAMHRDTQALSLTHPPVDIRLKNLEETLAALPEGGGFLTLD